MLSLFSQTDLLLLLRLVMAHLIVDFLFQTDFWVEQRLEKKWTSGWLYAHGAFAGVLAYIFTGLWSVIWMPLIIFISHVLLDGLKSRVEDTAQSFLLDQIGHLIVILVCWVLLVSDNITDILIYLISETSNVKLWILLISYTLIIWPASIYISKIIKPWREEIKEISAQSLDKAGLLIGRLERILILTFVLLQRFEAIGFLIAAKSIFRFSEIRSPNCRKEAEYILIGTMISFVIAIILGIFTSWILQYSLALGK